MRQLIIHSLGKSHYLSCLTAMQAFTAQRTDATTDELWITEHWPVFTQGQAGKPEHLLQPTEIPVIKTDRGGQITYHAPGQLILYPLLNLKANQLTIKTLVYKLEEIIIHYLSTYKIQATRKPKAPGVYVNHEKIASLGLRIRRGASYHGLSFNVDMDLTPFSTINPCGLINQPITQCSKLIPNYTSHTIQQDLSQLFIKIFNYQQIKHCTSSLEALHERTIAS